MLTYLCILVCVLISKSSGSNNLPNFVTICNRSDPKISECMKSNIEKLRQYSDIAIPAFNISRIDPWKSQSQLHVTKDTLSANVTNIEFAGTKNFKVTGINVKLTSNYFMLKLLFPKINHKCTATTKGTLFNVNVGKNPSVDGFADLMLCMKLRGKRIFKNGKEHIKFNDSVVIARGRNLNAVHNFILGTAMEKSTLRTMLKSQMSMFIPMYNYFAKNSIGNDIARIIVEVYENFPLDDLHPAK